MSCFVDVIILMLLYNVLLVGIWGIVRQNTLVTFGMLSAFIIPLCDCVVLLQSSVNVVKWYNVVGWPRQVMPYYGYSTVLQSI